VVLFPYLKKATANRFLTVILTLEICYCKPYNSVYIALHYVYVLQLECPIGI